MFTEALQKQLETAVGRAEQTTGAEIVVVLARSSGSYRDVDYLAGGIVACVLLEVILYARFVVELAAILPDLLIGFAITVILARRGRVFRRGLTSARRRRRQVRSGSELAFVHHAVGATRERTGVLIYYSALEDELEILPDLAIQARVPGHAFNETRHRFARSPGALEDRLAAAIEQIARALAGPFPAVAGRVNELPDRPRLEEEVS